MIKNEYPAITLANQILGKLGSKHIHHISFTPRPLMLLSWNSFNMNSCELNPMPTKDPLLISYTHLPKECL